MQVPGRLGKEACGLAPSTAGALSSSWDLSWGRMERLDVEKKRGFLVFRALSLMLWAHQCFFRMWAL